MTATILARKFAARRIQAAPATVAATPVEATLAAGILVEAIPVAATPVEATPEVVIRVEAIPAAVAEAAAEIPVRTSRTIPKWKPLLRVSSSLTVDLKTDGGAVTSVVEVTDDELHKLTLYTDGRKLPQSTDENNLQVAAHWNGSQLVSDEKSPLGGKMSRTFELSFDGRQLIETLRIDNSKSKTPITIRYVYNAANSEQLTGEDSDPDRPVLKRHSDDAGSPTQ